MRRRAQGILVVAALMIATVLGALWVPEGAPPAPPRPTGTLTPSPATVPPSPGATPVAEVGDLYDAVLPEQRAAIVAATAGRVPAYTIEATLTPPAAGGELPTVTGNMTVRYVNTTGAAVDALPFRLNPNLRQYETGRMTLDAVTVDGDPVTPSAPALHAVPASTPVATPTVAEADLILVWVPLAEPLAPGEAVTVAMAFETDVPIDPPDDTGFFRYHPDRGSWTLGHWYPMLAGYDPESGWDIEPPAAWSDITFGTTALYDVTLTAPDDVVLITPGVERRSARGDGVATTRFVSGPARDFPVLADPALIATSAESGGTTITVYAPAGSEIGAGQVLDWASQALKVYGDRFGAYPYTTLDIVAVPDLIGYEFPEMIWLGEERVADPEGSGSRPTAVEFLVAHEVAHQWWYGLVGSDPHRHAFLDEGLADYSAVLYFELVHGSNAARAELGQALTLPYATMLVTTGDAVADQPATAFRDATSYYATSYRKAGLGFAAIRAAIGDDAWFAALREYADAHRFSVASPGDLLAAFEAASGDDLGDLWRLWFASASGRVQIIMEPQDGTPVVAPSG
jgi:hypothetical protein